MSAFQDVRENSTDEQRIRHLLDCLHDALARAERAEQKWAKLRNEIEEKRKRRWHDAASTGYSDVLAEMDALDAEQGGKG